MEQTPNYALSQWDEQDRILREDFNANNAKVEQALAEQADTLAQHTAALAKCGNCKIVYGSYTGNGNSGSDHPNRLTFSLKPLMVFVISPSTDYAGTDYCLRMTRPMAFAMLASGGANYENTVVWGDRSVQWSNKKGSVYQFNSSGDVYNYVAFLAADE